MNITPDQKRIVKAVVNVFETGRAYGGYHIVTTLNDGPNKQKQVTYGKCQLAESGKLKEMLQEYIAAKGSYAVQIMPYMDLIGKYEGAFSLLANNETFKDTLKEAGNYDSVMHEVQDKFFDDKYFIPALDWFVNHNFIYPLSLLVVYDSYIHSGQIFDWLRKRFSASPRHEKDWVTQYVEARKDWLATSANRVLHSTVYRMECFEELIKEDNWDLSQLPIVAHGVKVK